VKTHVPRRLPRRDTEGEKQKKKKRRTVCCVEDWEILQLRATEKIADSQAD